MPYAEVAVNAATPLRQTFTYRVPQSLPVAPGHAVYVPFGSRTLQGVVMELTDEPRFADARDITALIEPRPLVSTERLAVASWMSGYYLAPLFECVSLMLPPGFKRRPLTILRPAVWVSQTPEAALSDLTETQRAVFAVIVERGKVATEELQRLLKAKGVPAAVTALVRRGLLERCYRLSRPAVKPKVVPHLKPLTDEEALRTWARLRREEGTPRAQRRALIAETLAEEGAIPLSQARRLGLTAAALRDLRADGVATVEDVTVIRDPLAGRTYAKREAPPLTPDQDRAAGAISAALEGEGGSFLLHGVTGSGKTEVYLAALERALALGKRAIVLVPEISLTPQTVRRFGERFPGRVAVMHSGLSLGEQFDIWHEIRDGRYDVVVGPRGALFAPQPDLGLIIVDEEHEWTYKQHDAAPRYHARRVAEELCRRTGAVLVLGSATPDVETHFRALSDASEGRGPLRLLELPQRLVRRNGAAEPAPLPEVEVIDLREELKAGNRSIFSRALADAMEEALSQNQQVILFLNRRGTASFLQCRDCGNVPRCRSCEVALTYHAPDGALVCHYCNRRQAVASVCAQCGSQRLRPVGIGTERVEEEVRRSFPGARTLRWDRDVTRGRNAHEAILARFLAHEADILIGTQMIVKGLDIPLVTLVGVISADIALHLPDFRAGERTFQLLEQVAGRSGRGPGGGRVIVQTYTPNHYAIQAAADHDYHALYSREVDFRRRLGYPPFGRLVRLTFSHTGAAYSREQAAALALRLRRERERLGIPNLDILGPSPAFVPRVRGRWRWNVLLRGSDPAALLRDLPLPRGWTVDVDPVSVL